MTAPPLRSPIHQLMQDRRDTAPGGRIANPSHKDTLVLRDLSTRPKLGLKGAGAEAWLRSQGLDVPPATYDSRALADGGLIVRLGAADFFLEGAGEEQIARLATGLDQHPAQVYRVERQDAGFLLAGARALDVLAQLCSIDFRSAPAGRLILTRAGGINCAVLPEPGGDAQTFRLWVDYTYGTWFWDKLATIVGELSAGFSQESS